ncbi:ankyrin repeat domain-containing protein [Nonomuraea fuscirosea]|uniref:ankyrin repeat domain-containing protein n=1 Tax=Nonomuraea fuscirosea TaxID=1291556 RepID=UPI0033FCDAB6
MTGEDLVTAATCGENEEAGRLLAAGLSPDEPGDDGGTALYRAAVQGHAALVRTLLAAGADPDRESAAEDEGLPLCAAACWGHLGAVTALLDAGADPDLREDAGRSATTALHWAAANEHLSVLNALLDAGADPDVRDSTGGTALSRAARQGAPAVVRALLDRGADPAPAGGRSPLDAAREFAGRDAEAEVRALAGAYARPGARIGVRRERSGGGDVRVVAEVRDEAGELRSEHSLGTGHAEIVRLLESRRPGPPGGHPAS